MDDASSKQRKNIEVGSTPILQSQVTYYKGRTTLSAVSATLSWVGQNISLRINDPKAAPNSEIIFQHTLSEIKGVTVSPTGLRFDTISGKYWIEFSYKASVLMGIGSGLKTTGAVGSVVGRGVGINPAKDLLEKAGYNVWIDRLKSAGVRTSGSKLFIYLPLVLLAVVVIFLLLAPK